MILGILRDWHIFTWQSLDISNVFNNVTLKQIFWKAKTFFKELEYRFLVEITKIENAMFLHKTAFSEANIKTNRMGSTKNRVLPVTALFFWKLCISIRTSYKRLIWWTNYPNVHIHSQFLWALEFYLSFGFLCEYP